MGVSGTQARVGVSCRYSILTASANFFRISACLVTEVLGGDVATFLLLLALHNSSHYIVWCHPIQAVRWVLEECKRASKPI